MHGDKIYVFLTIVIDFTITFVKNLTTLEVCGANHSESRFITL